MDTNAHIDGNQILGRVEVQRPWYSKLAHKAGVGLSTLAATGIILAGCADYSGNNAKSPPVAKTITQPLQTGQTVIPNAQKEIEAVNAEFEYKYDKTFFLTDDCPEVKITGRLNSLGKGFDSNYEQGIANITPKGKILEVSLHNIPNGNLQKLYENKTLHPSIELNIDTNGDSRYDKPVYSVLKDGKASFDLSGLNIDLGRMKYQVGATVFTDADKDGDLDRVYVASWRSDKSGCGGKMAPITGKKLETIIKEQAPAAPAQLTVAQDPQYIPTPFSVFASDGYVTKDSNTFAFKDYKWQIDGETGTMDKISIEDLADLMDYKVKGWESMYDEAKHVVAVRGDLNMSKEKIRSHAATSPAYIPEGYDELVLKNAKNVVFHPSQANHMTAKYQVSLNPNGPLGYRQLDMLDFDDFIYLADALVSGDNAAFINHVDSNHDKIIQPGEISHIYFVRMNDIRSSGNIAGSYQGRGLEPVYHWDGTKFMIGAPYSSGAGAGGASAAGPGGPAGGGIGGGQGASSGMGN